MIERRWLIAAIIFLTAFGFYLRGAYPSVSSGDSGEFITAGRTLGIPHAPGYPTYTLLVKIVSAVLPWGNSGYRVNLFSALFGAAAVALVFLVALRLKVAVELSVCAALIFMLGRAQCVNAQASEVFALHAVFCGGVLWAVVSYQWSLAAFLLGVGMGNHQTMLFLVPALLWAWSAQPQDHRAPLWSVALSGLMGLSVYGFLWMRASQSPLMNMGDPDTLGRFWRVFTRADYGSMTLALGETPARTWLFTFKHLQRFFHGLSEQVTWAGVVLGFLGLIAGTRKQPAATLACAAAFGLLGPVFFIFGNLPFDAQSLGLLERFYIAPVLCWTLLLALGFQFIAERRRGLALAAFVLPLLMVFQQGEAFSFRGDIRAHAYGRNNLRTLPPNSLFVMDGGDDTFYTLAYLTDVEKRRPDVELRDRGGVVFPGFYGRDFRALNVEEKKKRRVAIERAARVSGRPMYYSTMNELIAPETLLHPEGMLYRAGGRSRDTDLWPLYDLRGIAPWNARSRSASTDYRTRALLPFYAYQRSVHAARLGDWASAAGFADAAQAAGPDVVWLTPNLMSNGYRWGQLLFEAGQFDVAARVFRLLAAWDPLSPGAWSNVGAIEERRGHLAAAVEAYQRAIALDRNSEAAHYNLAVAYWKLSRWRNVVEELERVLAINPQHAAARGYLIRAQAELIKAGS